MYILSLVVGRVRMCRKIFTRLAGSANCVRSLTACYSLGTLPVQKQVQPVVSGLYTVDFCGHWPKYK